ncbi:MAG: type II toxin-antitoxin system PemK/MazF family toxin [Thiohalomonadaceae bacterium]
MTRGALVTIALTGDFGKPRPALVIQADHFDEHASVTVLPVTSTLVDTPIFRITVQASERNGLQQPSQIMLDKAVTVKRDRIGHAFGLLDADSMLAVDRSLAVFLGIAK